MAVFLVLVPRLRLMWERWSKTIGYSRQTLAALRGRLKQFTRISAFDERFGIACVACVKDNCQKRTINN
jgi:hypothetical protein